MREHRGRTTGDIVASTEGAEPIGEAPSLAGVDFSSDNSAEKAANLGLDASHFAGLKPSGKGGYTSKDVDKALAKANG